MTDWDLVFIVLPQRGSSSLRQGVMTWELILNGEETLAITMSDTTSSPPAPAAEALYNRVWGSVEAAQYPLFRDHFLTEEEDGNFRINFQKRNYWSGEFDNAGFAVRHATWRPWSGMFTMEMFVVRPGLTSILTRVSFDNELLAFEMPGIVLDRGVAVHGSANAPVYVPAETGDFNVAGALYDLEGA